MLELRVLIRTSWWTDNLTILLSCCEVWRRTRSSFLIHHVALNSFESVYFLLRSGPMTKHYAEPASNQNHSKQQNGTLGMTISPASLWNSDCCSWHDTSRVRDLPRPPELSVICEGLRAEAAWVQSSCRSTFQDKHGPASVKTDVPLLFRFSTKKHDRNSIKFGADQNFWIWRNSTNRGVNQGSEPTSVSLSKPSAALLKPKAMPEATWSGQWAQLTQKGLWVTAFWWSLGGDVVLLFNFLCLAALKTFKDPKQMSSRACEPGAAWKSKGNHGHWEGFGWSEESFSTGGFVVPGLTDFAHGHTGFHNLSAILAFAMAAWNPFDTCQPAQCLLALKHASKCQMQKRRE